MLPIFAEALAGIAIRAVQTLLPNTPADKLELLRLQIQQQAMENDVLKGQLEVNAAEAANSNRSWLTWRELVGYACAAAFIWSYVVQPFLVFIIVVAGHPLPQLPELDMAQLMMVLGTMLGVGGLKTFEKVKGVK